MKAPAKSNTPFNGSGSWNWNHVPTGGIPTRERCLSVSTPGEREQAVKLIQAYRAQEAIAKTHDIDSMSKELDVMARTAGSAHGSVPGEMLRRQIRDADHGKYEEAQAELRKLRAEALALITPYLKRLVISLDDSLNESALAAEQRIESEGFGICNGETWTLHTDGVCQALWFRRVKAEKTLAEIEPNGAIAVRLAGIAICVGPPLVCRVASWGPGHNFRAQALRLGLDGWSCSGILNPQKFKIDSCEMEKRRPLRRQPNDHNFGSLLMLAVTTRAFIAANQMVRIPVETQPSIGNLPVPGVPPN
jgi:hypothetical protein